MAARKRIQQKIRSQRGASLTWGLLMFLVCAVIGSVVLTAGTAAAGRLSRMAVTEQRYYAVNSAAELLVQRLTGQTVVAEMTMKKRVDIGTTIKITTSTETVLDGEGNPLQDEEGNPVTRPKIVYEYLGETRIEREPEYEAKDLTVTETETNFDVLLKDLAKRVLYGPSADTLSAEQQWKYRADNPNEPLPGAPATPLNTWKISVDLPDEGTDKEKDLLVDVTPTLRIIDGVPEMELIICNHVDAGSRKDQYTLKMLLSLDESSFFNQDSTEPLEGDDAEPLPTEDSYTEAGDVAINTITTYAVQAEQTTRRSEIRWKVTGLTVEGKMSNESNP